MGSPDFAVPALKNLAENYYLVGVVSQPDKPAGRGRELNQSPVKIIAKTLGIPVFQPERIREPEAYAQLAAWRPDLIVVAAYGQILRQNILALPTFGCINIHGSLLPRWRGASPIQAAIIAGDEQTGITIMKMEAGLDTGPIIASHLVKILPEDTAGTLGNRLALVGADVLIKTLPSFLEGLITPTPQDEGLSTYAGLIKKEDGQLDFNLSAVSLERRVRAFNPWPSAWTYWRDGFLKIHRAHVFPGNNAIPEKRSRINKSPIIGTGDGWLVLDEVQPAGKKSMAGDVFLRGVCNWDQ
jgi:methionyl-tRNA formyltransferase